LEQSPVTAYLRGDKDAYLAYQEVVKKYQPNAPAYTVERVESLLESIRSHGYSGTYLVLINSDPVIADGQHRAAILYHLFGGDMRIRIANIVTRGKQSWLNQEC